MSCYENQIASEGTSSGTVEDTVVTSAGSESTISESQVVVGYDEKYKVGVLTKGMKQYFVDAANKYHLDWRWIAALAYCESKWKTASAINLQGYFNDYKGLCGFTQKTLREALGKDISNPSVTNPAHQALAAAKRMNEYIAVAKKNGFSDEECYLCAGIAHNIGSRGALWAYNNAKPKNITGMQMVLLNCDGGYGPHAYKSGWFEKKNMTKTELHKESREKATYPNKMKTAYMAICRQYKY